jgi:hypothetical protein
MFLIEFPYGLNRSLQYMGLITLRRAVFAIMFIPKKTCAKVIQVSYHTARKYSGARGSVVG